MIGGYGCTFDKRAAFVYTALTDIEALFVRKMNWKVLLEENPIIAVHIKSSIFNDYF